jgi:hypothetical protein
MEADEGGSDGVAVLEDPGVAWQASHAYADGDRFRETLGGIVRVFEITTAGTSGSGVFANYGPVDLGPGNDWGTGTEVFSYIGDVGKLPWTVAPALVPALTLSDYDGDGRALRYTSDAPPDASSALFAFRTTLAGSPELVFEAKSDGDADWMFEDGNGPAFRFSNRSTGPGSVRVEASYEGLSVIGNVGSFVVNFDPFFVRMIGLPTADPVVAGQLWNSAGTLKVSAG